MEAGAEGDSLLLNILPVFWNTGVDRGGEEDGEGAEEIEASDLEPRGNSGSAPEDDIQLFMSRVLPPLYEEIEDLEYCYPAL